MIEQIRQKQRTWLVTGAAGFIGSHLAERLLSLDQRVVAVDNFATGKRENLKAITDAVSPAQAARFTFFEQDISDRDGIAALIVRHVPEVILHQAALGSVPRSIADPLTSHHVNVDGFVNMLEAARGAEVKRFVYASSSSVYGDISGTIKSENTAGECLSPYAVTKRTNELYARVYGKMYGLETVGLRYFNVFGPRQDPQGPYAAVIPRWLSAMSEGRPCVIFGDGTTSRDFCYIDNVVQANLLAALIEPTNPVVNGWVNIACGATTTLEALHAIMRGAVARARGVSEESILPPTREPFRSGDVRHSLADISLAQRELGYVPAYSVAEGIIELVRAHNAQIG